MTTIWTRIEERVSRFFFGSPTRNSAASAEVDDSPGWANLTQRPHDYDLATLQELYADALTAWRKNPIAWRIIAITTDYIVGDQIRISSPNRSLAKFIPEFWNHPKNAMDSRLEPMSDELARAGDLFIALFRNSQDGMSYLRFITKDNIVRIETAENDWENELVYTERTLAGEERRWLSPTHPEAAGSDAILLHYAVNRPVGALMGESDLTTMIPWLQRYSRMLEDRVRLHWAVRAFLWIVTVPTNLVNAKKEQYRLAPDSGSIVVKDEAEKWEVYSPSLRGADASHDLQAVRGMIDAGSGYPPHWRGEAGEANLATATAMQAPTERHLRRRQQYFMFVLKDILYQAYLRSAEIGRSRSLPGADYERLFTVVLPEISRSDNSSLAQAAQSLANALAVVRGNLPGKSDVFARLMLRLVLRFAGEPQTDEVLDEIMDEAVSQP